MLLFSDAEYHAAGGAVSQHAETPANYNDTSKDATLYIMRQADFHQEGLLLAWELFATATGSLDLMVRGCPFDTCMELILSQFF